MNLIKFSLVKLWLTFCLFGKNVLTIAPISNECKCSHTKNDLWPPLGRMVDGEAALQGQYPWTVAIFAFPDSFMCAGILINEKWVLTNTFCLEDYIHSSKIHLLFVGYGSRHLKSLQKHQNWVKTVKIPVLKQQKRPRLLGELALLELENDVQFGVGVQPACLSQINHLNMSNYSMDVVGWGVRRKLPFNSRSELKEIKKNISKFLLKGKVKISNDLDYTCRIRKDLICIDRADPTNDPKETKPGSPCFLDLGSPLHVNRNGYYHIVGLIGRVINQYFPNSIIDSSTQCNGKAVAIRLSMYMLWIQREVNMKSCVV